MKENPFYILCGGLLLVTLVHLFPFQTKAEKPPVPPVTAPAAIRSLEKIDHWNSLGEPDIYLFRVMTCYYVIIDGTHPVLAHLESCPSPEHRKPSLDADHFVHPGDPIIGRPLGIPSFGGIEDLGDIRRMKK